jgi:quinohemoprotein ethanol dehydrogenase
MAVVIAGCSGASSPNPSKGGPAEVEARRIIDADREPGVWMTTGRTYDEQRFSPLSKITTNNVQGLGLAWSYRLDVDRATEATPLVVDGMMYVTGDFSILSALDPMTGKERWRYDPKVPRDKGRDGCCDVANRGVAIWKGKVFLGAYDGRLIALDARTGDKIWETDTVPDKTRSYTVTGAPRVINGRVIIGNGGAELGVRGFVAAYDVDSGRQLWKFYTVPGDPKQAPENDAMKLARTTWTGDQFWTFGGGGTVWDSMAYDPELDLLYIGVGNGSPWNRKLRSPDGGDNLFLSSIVALKPATGEYVWHYQTTPGDNWDYTATQHIILAELPIAGKQRKVLMQAPKNGFFYVLDRATGELLSADKFAKVTWATHVDLKTGRPVENPEADWTKVKNPTLVYPGPIGAHNWQPMSFNPTTGLVYIPTNEAPALYLPDNGQRFTGRGNWHLGMPPIGLPESSRELKDVMGLFKGALIAWDPVAKREVWRQDLPHINNGGVLSTAGGVVFQGTADGRFVAYSAKDGSKLWEAPANTGVVAAPISYELGGEQYISVAAGWGGGAPLVLGAIASSGSVGAEARVLTFKLGGKETLPPPKKRPTTLPEPPALTADEATINRGRDLYNANCGMCHGPSALAASVLPDLRYLTPEKHRIFAGILAGAYASKGMPSVMDKLSAADVEAVHQYIIKRAHDAWKEQSPEVSP